MNILYYMKNTYTRGSYGYEYSIFFMDNIPYLLILLLKFHKYQYGYAPNIHWFFYSTWCVYLLVSSSPTTRQIFTSAPRFRQRVFCRSNSISANKNARSSAGPTYFTLFTRDRYILWSKVFKTRVYPHVRWFTIQLQIKPKINLSSPEGSWRFWYIHYVYRCHFQALLNVWRVQKVLAPCRMSNSS